MSSQALFDAQDRQTFDEAVETWGIDAQADMAEEEAAEFIVASKHWARGRETGVAEVIEELADLRIMQEQLTQYLGRDRVEAKVQEKMERLRERIEEANHEQ